MAVRARLTNPRRAREDWPWHDAEWMSLPASILFPGDRRMEAEAYLSPGFAIRHAISSRPGSWTSLSDVARIWQPPRLKGVQVVAGHGVPFLTATQVFDMRPMPRKWLSLERTRKAERRFVAEGTILMTCSGSVGRTTLADRRVGDMLISHDLLRIEVREERLRGWVYAFLRAPAVRAMLTSTQYGHIIKHLEVAHLEKVPLVLPDDDALLDHCASNAARIIDLRNRALASIEMAERAFENLFSPGAGGEDTGNHGFVRWSGDVFGGRRRLDAFHYNPVQNALTRQLASGADRMDTLRAAGCVAWLPNRFRRVPAQDGVDLIDSSSVFRTNPESCRKISPTDIQDANGGAVEAQWLLMSRSGQVYGLLGSVAMATRQYGGKIVTDDIIRIATGDGIHPGYLQLALSHVRLGRPRVKSLAYGSSVPHIEVEDLLNLRIPRIAAQEETKLGDMVWTAFEDLAKADRMENDLTDLAEMQIGINRSRQE